MQHKMCTDWVVLVRIVRCCQNVLQPETAASVPGAAHQLPDNAVKQAQQLHTHSVE